MKRITILSLLKISLFIVFFTLFTGETLSNNTAAEFKPVDPNKIPDILTMISNRTKSNFEQIKTWQGKLEIVTDYIYVDDRAKEVFTENTKYSGQAPKKLLEHRETNIEFSLDAENELLYVEYYSDSAKPLLYIDLENGKDLEAKGILGNREAILTPEYQIDCIADTMRDGVIMSRRAVKQSCPNSSKCSGHPVYDPRGSLSIGDQIWEFFPRIVEHIKKHGKFSVGEFDLQVEERKTEDTNDYRIIMPSRIQGDENYLFHEMVFSGDNGFNVVSFETTYQNGKDANKITFKKVVLEYTRLDDVYIPCHRSEQTFDVPSGKLEREQKITFKNQKVNEAIPTKTFTYKNLNLKNDDKFIDKILDKEYIYKNEELIPVTKED